jgi:hypothetical protein
VQLLPGPRQRWRRSKLRAIDVEPVASTPKEFSATMATETRQWRELADRLGIKPE